jgi:glutamate dehydrogenase/leucine dehydrogenase
MIEGAHGPVSRAATACCRSAASRSCPTSWPTAAAVVIGYFEWVQNRMGFAWTATDVVDAACAAS